MERLEANLHAFIVSQDRSKAIPVAWQFQLSALNSRMAVLS